jgi:hypothetical protein
MAALAADREDSQRRHALLERRHTFGIRFAVGIALVSAAVLSLFLFMAFFGDSEQKRIALMILPLIMAGIAGYGLLNPIVKWVRRMIGDATNGTNGNGASGSA